MTYFREEKNVVFNAYQQLSFFTAEKSDIRVRATIISSVNFTIVFRLFYFFFIDETQKSSRKAYKLN